MANLPALAAAVAIRAAIQNLEVLLNSVDGKLDLTMPSFSFVDPARSRYQSVGLGGHLKGVPANRPGPNRGSQAGSRSKHFGDSSAEVRCRLLRSI